MSPRLGDLFCCAGGASKGYADAGFEVIGIDHDPRVAKRYPFEVRIGEWLDLAAEVDQLVDVWAASPPCQSYSITKHTHSVEHPDLLGPVRDFLISTGKPYIIENVVGAPLRSPLLLCGSMFGLTAQDDQGINLWLRRHRLFESNVLLYAPAPCTCKWYARRAGWHCGGVYGGGSATLHQALHVRHGGYTPPMRVRKELMGIDWMTEHQLSQAIPPAYSYWLGCQLRDYLRAVA